MLVGRRLALEVLMNVFKRISAGTEKRRLVVGREEEEEEEEEEAVTPPSSVSLVSPLVSPLILVVVVLSFDTLSAEEEEEEEEEEKEDAVKEGTCTVKEAPIATRSIVPSFALDGSRISLIHWSTPFRTQLSHMCHA